MIQKVPKTVETPEVQFVDTEVDFPEMAQRQVPSVQRVHIDKYVEMRFVMRRQVPMIEKVGSSGCTGASYLTWSAAPLVISTRGLYWLTNYVNSMCCLGTCCDITI